MFDQSFADKRVDLQDNIIPTKHFVCIQHVQTRRVVVPLQDDHSYYTSDTYRDMAGGHYYKEPDEFDQSQIHESLSDNHRTASVSTYTTVDTHTSAQHVCLFMTAVGLFASFYVIISRYVCVCGSARGPFSKLHASLSLIVDVHVLVHDYAFIKHDNGPPSCSLCCVHVTFTSYT